MYIVTNSSPKCLYMMQHAYKYKNLNEMRFVDAADKWLSEGGW